MVARAVGGVEPDRDFGGEGGVTTVGGGDVPEVKGGGKDTGVKEEGEAVLNSEIVEGDDNDREVEVRDRVAAIFSVFLLAHVADLEFAKVVVVSDGVGKEGVDCFSSDGVLAAVVTGNVHTDVKAGSGGIWACINRVGCRFLRTTVGMVVDSSPGGGGGRRVGSGLVDGRVGWVVGWLIS